MRPRRSYVGLPILLAMAAILVGTLPVDAARKVTLGVTVETPDPRQEATFDAFTNLVDGVQPRIWTLISKWGNRHGNPQCEPDAGRTCAFPTEAVNWIRARGAIPMIFWEPYRDVDSCDFARFSQVNNGSHDPYIRAWAQAAAEYGGKVLLRYAHEINGGFFPWGLKNDCGNTAAQFRSAWRRVHGIFKDAGATNVKFLWTVSNQKCDRRRCNPFKAAYPGDAYVDYVGFSAFNWGRHSGHQWQSMTSLVGNAMGYLKQFTRKPVIVAELATNRRGGNKPAWIRDGYNAVYRRYPSIKAIVYLNVDLRYLGHVDWSLKTPSASYEAYERVARQTRFKGQL
jgi:Glycosyl hydrolase family 26